MADSHETTQVLIVGGGPAGLVSALLLARRGISSIVIERNAMTDDHPKAHELNARSVEILEQIGITTDDLAVEASPLSDGSRVLFCRTINEEIGRIDILAEPERAEQYATHLRSELPYFNLSQSEFEKLLAARVQESPQIDLRFGHTWKSLGQDADAVRSTVVGDDSKTYTVESRYVLAADGASSPVRRSLGIEMDGPKEIQNFINAYFKANLRAHVNTPAKLYWILKPQAAGAFIAHHIDRRWVYAIPIQSPYETVDDFPVPVLQERIRVALELDEAPEIVSTSTWRMTAQLAPVYRKGRVLLVGDSAHRFPPTGGLGMNTGIGDAHNLCWKLAAVLEGRAGDALLDTYESERRPVARRNRDESLENFHRIWEVFEAMGIQRDGPEMLARVFGTAPVKWLPRFLREGLKSFALSIADRQVRNAIESPEVHDRVTAAIANQVPHFDRLGLDIGYVYESGALIDDGSRTKHGAHDGIQYEPSCAPGARVPHVPMDGGSTHDAIAYDGFTIFTARDDMETVARSVSDNLGVTVRVSAVPDDPIWNAASPVSRDGLILSRPDGHVAWCLENVDIDVERELREALKRVLAKEATKNEGNEKNENETSVHTH